MSHPALWTCPACGRPLTVALNPEGGEAGAHRPLEISRASAAAHACAPAARFPQFHSASSSITGYEPASCQPWQPPVSAGAEDDEGVLSQSEYTLTKPSSCPNHRDHVKRRAEKGLEARTFRRPQRSCLDRWCVHAGLPPPLPPLRCRGGKPEASAPSAPMSVCRRSPVATERSAVGTLPVAAARGGDRSRFEIVVRRLPAYAGGGGRPRSSGTTGSAARNIAVISGGRSRLRWRAVRTTLARTCWVSAPWRVRFRRTPCG